MDRAKTLQMYDLYLNGLSMLQIAEKYGITKQAVSVLFKTAKLKTKRKGLQKALTLDRVNELYEEYKKDPDGFRNKTFELTVNSIFTYFKENNLPFLHKRRVRTDSKFTTEQIKEIHAEYMQGDYRIKDMAKKYGLCELWLQRLFLKLGLENKKRGIRKDIS